MARNASGHDGRTDTRAPTDAPRGHGPDSQRQYRVTYAFDERAREMSADATLLVRDAVAEMHREGVEVAFLGATAEVDAQGRPTEVTVRFAAPNKGTIGRLNCRSGLPASGGPRPADVPVEPSGAVLGEPVAVVGRDA